MAGQLLIADLILTGALTDMGDEWDINLRILNVRTGQALSAVSMRDRLFKPTELRDTGPFVETFEGSRFDPSWIVRAEAKGAKKKQDATSGDQVMRLSRVEGIQFRIGSANNEGASGSIWIDQIRLYTD